MSEPSIGPPSGPASAPDLVVVGAAARDVDADDPRGWRLGGSVSYGALTAARLGLRVRALVGVDEEAATARELDVLRDEGVEIRLVRLVRGPVFHNRLTPRGRVQRAVQPSDPLPAHELPAAWRAAPAMLLVPVAGELGDDWASAPGPSQLVALGWQGLLRRMSAGRLVEPLPLRPGRLSERADIAVVSAEDAVAGGAPLAELLSRPGQELAVTHGPLGAVHVARLPGEQPPLRFRRVPAIASRPIDPTGAGDVFLAAWTAARVCAPSASVWRQMAVASAAGSITVELAALRDLPRAADVGRRLLRRHVADLP